MFCVIPDTDLAYYTDTTDLDLDFSEAKVLKFPRGKRNKHNRRRALDILCAWDTETSRINIDGHDHSFTWLSQFQLGLGMPVLLMRDMESTADFFKSLAKAVPDYAKLVIYVHNLSYEFQFLAGVYNFQSDEVFAPKARKVLKCSMYDGALEFRCSWYLTNMSLREACIQYGTPHKKLDDFNYDELRYPWSTLTDTDISYSINDCYCTTEIVDYLLRTNDDDLMSIPATNTGYVRRDMKHNTQSYKEYLKLQSLKPTYEVFKLLDQAFRGGNTHANWLYTGEIIENVESYDRSSSYPDSQVNDLYPVTPFEEDTNHTITHLVSLINYGKACLFEITFTDITQKPGVYFSYISESKCRDVESPLRDNGRVTYAHKLTTTLTDIDFRIINADYDYRAVKIHSLYTSRYGRASKGLIALNREYYIRKTQLKDVPGEEVYYLKSKNRLNSAYGMSAQSPLKRRPIFVDGKFIPDDSLTDEELFQQGNASAVLPYQWGVWTTAHARYHLQVLLWKVGDAAVYWDTDSVKFIADPENPIDLSDINGYYSARSKDNNACADDRKGSTHYMGVYEKEHTYSRFTSLGAKKYAYEYADSPGTCYCTISGVVKRRGGDDNINGRELYAGGGLETFAACASPHHHFTFRDAGGTSSIYNDDVDFSLQVGSHTLHITRNVVVAPSEYTLGIGKDYYRFLCQHKI